MLIKHNQASNDTLQLYDDKHLWCMIHVKEALSSVFLQSKKQLVFSLQTCNCQNHDTLLSLKQFLNYWRYAPQGLSGTIYVI